LHDILYSCSGPEALVLLDGVATRPAITSAKGSPISRRCVNSERLSMARAARRFSVQLPCSTRKRALVFSLVVAYSGVCHYDAPVTHQDQGDCESKTRVPLTTSSSSQKILGTRLPPIHTASQIRGCSLGCKRQPLPGWQSRRLASTHLNTGGRRAGPIRPWWFHQPLCGLAARRPKLYENARASSKGMRARIT
jgi:hypothetical protein